MYALLSFSLCVHSFTLSFYTTFLSWKISPRLFYLPSSSHVLLVSLSFTWSLFFSILLNPDLPCIYFTIKWYSDFFFFFLVLVFYYTYRFLSLLCQQFHPYFFCLASKDFILCVSSTTPSIGCISSLVPAVSSLFPRGLHEIDSLVRLGSVWCLTQRYNLLVISRKGLVWWWQTCCLWLMNYVCYLGLF